MAQGRIAMLPSFVPDESAPVSVSEQERFYNLIKGLSQLAFDEPLLFVTALHEDDAYPSRYKKSYENPKLIADMRKFTKSFDGLMQTMFLLGRGDDVKLSKRQWAVLSRLGVNGLTDLPAAWRWMSTRDGANVSTFSHCLFDAGYPYASEIYARLLGGSAFKKLEGWMLAQGYKRFDIDDVTASGCDLALTVANPKWGAEPPRGGFEYKIRHTGMSFQFDDYAKTPAVCGLCIPNGMKTYLESFDSMDEALQPFEAERTKKCDMCRYCVQTDKTGSRPLARTKVIFHGNEYRLCHYYPGYSYSWTSLNDGLVDMLIKMLTFMDRFAPGNSAGKI